jgi:CDP-diglyceride synthetase
VVLPHGVLPQLLVSLAVGMTALLAVLAPLGDLVESLSSVTPASRIPPTCSPATGASDRSDSLFFAAPFVLALFLLLGMRA